MSDKLGDFEDVTHEDSEDDSDDEHRLEGAEPAAQPDEAPRDDNDDTVLDDPQPEADERRHTVSESADKIVLKTNVKRGTGTRDEDKINVKCKGNDPEATAAKLAETLAALKNEGIAETLRETGSDE